jgi:glycerol-3-phosphate O-acyltransferase
MKYIGELFADKAAELQKNSRSTGVVTTEHVYQPANLANQQIVHSIANTLLLPESRFVNLEAFLRFAELSRQGKSCLLLVEHYSNFDIPNLYLVLERAGEEAAKAAHQIISVAGAKLNETSLFVRAFTEAFARLVIYPSRSLDNLRQDPVANAEEISRARAINMAALHEMVRLKHAGHIILVFPAGTRYRPGDESTKRGLKEMYSYIKSFDHLLFVGMAGNTLRINMDAANSMELDHPTKDALVFVASEVIDAHQFRNASLPTDPNADPKQAVADALMAELEVLHQKALEIHQAIPGIQNYA